jgi:hypothetical protein
MSQSVKRRLDVRWPSAHSCGIFTSQQGRKQMICYQEMTSEDIEDFMCVAVTVIFSVCKPVGLL